MQTLATSAFAIRAIVPDDREALERFYEALSADSLEARFHGGAPRISDSAACYFCGPDHRMREGFVAEVVNAQGRRTIVGHLCIEPLEPARPGVAEVAVVVADAWHRRGVGRTLLAAAIVWAEHHGIDHLSAWLLWGNAAMLNLVQSSGRPVSFGTSDAGTIEAIIDVRATSVAPRAA